MHYLLVLADFQRVNSSLHFHNSYCLQLIENKHWLFYNKLPAMPPTCLLPSSMLLSSSILAATSSCWWLCLSWSIAAACWWFSSERKEASYREQKEKLILQIFTINNNTPAPSSSVTDLTHTAYISHMKFLLNRLNSFELHSHEGLDRLGFIQY